MSAFTIKPAALSPFLRFAARICSLLGIMLVHKTGDNDKPASRGYLTLTAALAAWTAGKVIIVCPGTYAENVTVVDGCRVVLIGATIGTGAGAAVTIASPAGDEVGYIDGVGVLAGTASISAAAGAHLALGVNIDITGTVTGIYRRGRTWYLQSGASVSTLCPADGTVVPVLEGDALHPHPGDFGGLEFVCFDISGTKDWVSTAVASIASMARYSNQAGSKEPPYAEPAVPGVTHILYRLLSDEIRVRATHDASNYYTVAIDIDGATIGSFSTYFAGVDVSKKEHYAKEINTIVAIKPDHATWETNPPKITYTPTGGAVGNFDNWGGATTLSWIVR